MVTEKETWDYGGHPENPTGCAGRSACCCRGCHQHRDRLGHRRGRRAAGARARIRGALRRMATHEAPIASAQCAATCGPERRVNAKGLQPACTHGCGAALYGAQADAAHPTSAPTMASRRAKKSRRPIRGAASCSDGFPVRRLCRTGLPLVADFGASTAMKQRRPRTSRRAHPKPPLHRCRRNGAMKASQERRETQAAPGGARSATWRRRRSAAGIDCACRVLDRDVP
jgi:hypothetical protein